MSINIDKSFTLGFRPSPKDKISTIDVERKFQVGERNLRTMKRSDIWTYLGLPFTWARRAKIKINEVLENDLESLTHAALKRQQRLFALRTIVLPKLYHQLALGNVMLGTIKCADKKVRGAVRRWLNLPHDVPNAYVHASISDGGLGIPAMRWVAPLMRKTRLEAMMGILNVNAHSFIAKKVMICQQRLLDHETTLNSMSDINDWWASKLHNSLDASGLKESRETFGQHSWIGDGTKFLSGRDFIHSCRFRIGAIPTKARTSRGRHRDRRCRAGCEASETLHHVIQVCFRSHLTRVQRHDAVSRYVATKLRGKGYVVQKEPRIQTEDGLRKPDIVAYKEPTALVVDAQVVGEQFDLRRDHI